MHLRKQDIAALLAFASKDETRPWMACVYFEPADGTAVATDGHTLVRRTSGFGRSDGAEPFSISTADLVRASKLLCKGGTVEVSKDALTVGGQVLRPTPVEGRFPPYREVIAGVNRGACTKFGMTAKYLARLETVAGACGRDRGVCIETGATDLDPIFFNIDAADGAQWFGVIMPRRL
jgi:hypothetical protein